MSSGQPIYSGGRVTKFLYVDVDRLSNFELRGYIKELGYTTTCTFSIKSPAMTSWKILIMIRYFRLKLYFGRWRYCGGIYKALD